MKNVAPQWTIVSMVAAGPADDPCPVGLRCCSCPMDFSRACSGQERSAETEGKEEREAGLDSMFPAGAGRDLFWGR